LDTDKLIYAVLVTDSLANYDAREPFGCWPVNGLDTKIDERLRLIEDYAFAMKQPPNDILLLVVLQGIGRWQVLGFDRPVEPVFSPFLTMTAADLETIALLEGGEPLALWKYVRAACQIRSQTRVCAMGELDEFYIYRKSGYSYYISDEGRPSLLLISPGGAGGLRREVLRQRDWHAVPSYRPGYVVEVTALHDTRTIPIYIPMSSLGQQVALLVEGLPLPIWIIGPSYEENDEQRKLHALYAEFAEAIGYWVWQFTPSLYPILQSLAPKHSHILIRLHLPPSEAWHRIKEREKKLGEMPLDVSADSASGILTVILHPTVSLMLEGTNNSGERELMQHVLSGFRELLPNQEREDLSDEVIAAILDRHAPLGIKKKLFFLDTTVVPDLDPRGLPSYRKVQEADVNELLDELGDYLGSADGLNSGQIPDDQRITVLNKAVAFYYSELEGLVASLRPKGLLEWLVAYQEAVTRESSFHRLTIPTRLTCFSAEPEMVERLSKEIPELSKAAMASRFVIEYVVARPPTGLRPMSLSVYDRLLALASHIINFGFESDLIYFRLADIKLAMLPSGRLGVDREQYEKAFEAYLPIFATGEIARATQVFGRHWQSKEVVAEKPQLAARVDSAAQAEFGHSLTDLLTLTIEAVAVGNDLDPAVACLPLDDLIDRLVNRLGWPQTKVSHALELLSLGPRTDFLNPPLSYRMGDVYPWRFNRSLSYLRRPFLRRERDGMVEVLWGARHLYGAGVYLTNLIMSGQLRAQSPEMQQLLGEFNREQGEAFNNQVANLFEHDPTLIVQRRVKKVGKLRGPTGPPGDIDVLVADRNRQRMKVIECKDLAVARTPYEMANELTNLFHGQNSKKSVVEYHQRRVDWICKHLDEVLAWLGIDHTGEWKVEPLIVVDQELFTPFLRQSPIPVVSFAELAKG